MISQSGWVPSFHSLPGIHQAQQPQSSGNNKYTSYLLSLSPAKCSLPNLCIQPSKQPASNPRYMQHSINPHPYRHALERNLAMERTRPTQKSAREREREKKKKEKNRAKRCTGSVSSRCSPALPAQRNRSEEESEENKTDEIEVRVSHRESRASSSILAVVSWWPRWE